MALPDAAQLEDVLHLRQQLYVLYHRPQAEESQIWIRPLSPQGTAVASAQLLASIPLDEQFRSQQFDVEFNRDSSYLLLYNQYPPRKNGAERYTLRVFDAHFEAIWSLDIQLPYADRDFSVQEYRVDPEGNVYVLGRYAPLQANGRRKPATYLIVAYTRQGQTRTTYRIELDEVWVRALSFRLAPAGEIVCAGFYQRKSKPEDVGICHLRIDPHSREIHTVHLPSLQDQETVQKLPAQDFRLRQLALRSDGGVVLTAEQFTRNQSTAFTYNGPARLDIYSYQDILLANVAPDGNFSWVRRIPKIQTSINDGGVFSSFAQATIADRFYFLYNDSKARFQPTGRHHNGEYLKPERSVLTLTEVDRAGRVQTKPLLLHADQEVVTLPRWCRQVGPRQMLLYALSGRKYALGLVEF
ncbi:MAG: hypothetical protein D6772_05090 [Bacteroidetes bacterium]|nr:MAG: hypothetical protein D6772_05090 [Bacteroidota bacterium]